MRRNSRAYCLVTAWALITALILGGCVKAPAAEGDMWAPGVTFQMIRQPLTDQEKETIRSVLKPNEEDLFFMDEVFDPMDLNKNFGFSYRNSALSDAQKNEKVESKEEVLDMAESVLRSMNLLQAETDYYVDVFEGEGGYYGVSFYHKFHNIPVFSTPLPAIRIYTCKDGIESIQYENRYAIQAMDQTESAPGYISESQAIASYREKLKEKHCPEIVADEDLCIMRVYVYTEAGKAVPMYRFDDSNMIFVNAVSGEATDFPWGS